MWKRLERTFLNAAAPALVRVRACRFQESVKKLLTAGIGLGLLASPVLGGMSWDSERLNLEVDMQARVESALNKILMPGQFVIVVRVEPWAQPIDRSAGTVQPRDGYYLPGVPERSKFDGTADEIRNLVKTLKPNSPIFRKFIRRIAATLVLDQDLADEEVEKVRNLTRQILGLDPSRGDTLNVQRTVFQKPAIQQVSPEGGFFRLQREIRNYWFLISLALILVCVVVFFLFVFGPLRGFLNRFVQILPTLKSVSRGGSGAMSQVESQILPLLMAQASGMLPSSNAGPASPNFSGSLHVENPNKNTLPFGFIREDHLSNLALLLSRETPEKAAVVLGYLPPAWISRVLTRVEPGLQSEIAANLSTTKQLLPEQVEDIEQDLKRRLDYMIGGPERLMAIYETLDPDAQRGMLENLKSVRPDVAEELRRHSMQFEDLEKMDLASFKSLLREIDIKTLVTSLKEVNESLVQRVLENVTEGKAEIVREELEMGEAVAGKATLEAQRKILQIAKRLQNEGQIHIPEVDRENPSIRYDTPLRSTLKLPPTLKLDEAVHIPEDVVLSPSKLDIRERIRQFMNRGSRGRERFPVERDLELPEKSEEPSNEE